MNGPTLDALRDLFVSILFAVITIASWHYAVPLIARYALEGR